MRQKKLKLNMRKGLTFAAAMLILFAMCVSPLSFSVDAAESGTCGENLTWSLSGGTLTIEGSGEMARFTEADMAPWFDLRQQICRVSLPEGLRSVSSLAFYDCDNLSAVYLPDSIAKIGSYAFAECDQLESVRLGPNLAVIDTAAFHSCYKLTALSLPDSLQTLGNQAFYRCESLASVVIPPYLSTLGMSVFAYCKSLLRVEIRATVTSLPEWSFYGCERLCDVILPETVDTIEDYAFRECDLLETVYFNGDEEKTSALRSDLERELPQFDREKTLQASVPMDSTTAGQFTENEDGTVTQKNTTVAEKEGMSITTVLEHTHQPDTLTGGAMSAEITVTVEDKNTWDDVTEAVKQTMKSVNESVSGAGASSSTVDVTVYVQTEGGIDKTLVEDLAGRDVHLSVVAPNGNESRLECEDLVRNELSGRYSYSFRVEDAADTWSDALATATCFNLIFEESAQINSEILVRLPLVQPRSNACLYQVESDRSLKRLQSSVVDNQGNAHFYLASVNKDTEYVIGINVPSENPDDAIIPNDMLSHYGEKIEPLQNIDYVITGRESSWGLSVTQVTWIMLGILTACIIVVGTIMAVWNHRRLKRGYVPALVTDGDVQMETNTEK